VVNREKQGENRATLRLNKRRKPRKAEETKKREWKHILALLSVVREPTRRNEPKQESWRGRKKE
jgi:hypothetical protein